MRSRCLGRFGAAAVACVLAMPLHAGADVLELKNGQVLAGKYAGGTAGTIRFETSGGVRVVETSQALAVTFTTEPTAPAVTTLPASLVPAAPAAAAPAPAASSASVSVPAGTLLLVRMVDGASSRDPQGRRFTTVLETDLVVDGVMVAKAGTKLYGRVEKAVQAGRLAGKSVLDLRLCELTIGGSLVAIVTGPYAQAGARSIGKTAKGALAGAAVGALASGSDDVAKGAAVGALVSGLKPGQPIVVRPGTLLEFETQRVVAINIAH